MSVNNGGEFVSQAIESILHQTFTDFEFIIVDDASTDGSGDIIKAYARKDRRINVLDNTENIGLTASLNKALAMAKGRYVARMDADDISLPRRFQKQIDFLESRPDIGLTGTFYYEIDSQGKICSDIVAFPEEPIIIKWRLCFENPVPHPPIMAKKELICRVNGYNKKYRFAQDYDLFTRLSHITKIANIPDVLFHWRVHERSVSKSRNMEQREAAYTISRSYLNTLLGEDIESKKIPILWNRIQSTARQTAALSEILMKSCEVIVRESLWSPEEKRLLKRYVSQKLYYYLRPHAGRIIVWPELIGIMGTDPFIYIRMIKHRFIKHKALLRKNDSGVPGNQHR